MALPEVKIDFDPEVVIRTKFRAYLDAAEQAGEDAKAQAEQFVADMKEKAGVYIQGQIDEAQKCLDQIKEGFDNVEAACKTLFNITNAAKVTTDGVGSYAATTASVPIPPPTGTSVAFVPLNVFTLIGTSVTSTIATLGVSLSGQVSNLKAAVSSLASPLSRLSSLFMGFGSKVPFPVGVENPIATFYDDFVAPLSDTVNSLNDIIGKIPTLP